MVRRCRAAGHQRAGSTSGKVIAELLLVVKRGGHERAEPRGVEKERIVVGGGATFSGSEAKNAASALPDNRVEVASSNGTSGPSRILKPWSSSACARPAIRRQ